jgi:hypothetical protein
MVIGNACRIVVLQERKERDEKGGGHRLEAQIWPSATASRCLAVFAFLDMPLRRFPGPGAPSMAETGVAAPLGLLLSSKCPSPVYICQRCLQPPSN